jgi:hypothetical protein
MSAADRQVKLDDFSLGMNNRAPDFRLERKDGREVRSFLRSIVNADLTSQGTLRRRQGYARVIAGTACHSFWADGAVAYFADGANLVRMNPDVSYSTIHSNLAYGAPVSFAAVGTDTYYTDGARLRRLAADGTDHAAGVPLLLVEPTVTAAPGAGSLYAARYSVCVTQVNEDGEEGGSSIPQQVELTADGAITVSGLPTSFPAGVAALRIYLTPGNATTLMRAMTLAAPAASVQITVMPVLGARCPTVLMAPMPAGRIVRHLNGRLFVVVGNTLFYSEPYAPALRNPARGWVQFPAPITMLEPCINGFFIAADKTYWVPGDIASAEMVPVLPYGAVLGTSGSVPDELACWWMSHQGMVRGAPDGTVKNLQEENVAVDQAATGAALYREHDGMKQAVAALFGAEPTVLTARSWMDAEVVRKEEIL